ncbi:TrmH family RNA methyltransferase [Virgibacillus oceani]|uniref:tRNA/rRNA methyltransferase YsgA n=1 Tax=Virgibacillus oceani TaxID=1479511 RepID=A0A917GZ48_9BACI|nr:RNA methyltransferase [Virgibacillus oceani]GGG62098.1 putative tRNA/rRNA methyltransferase YsgA [Virgibacillus oceani]
MIISVQNEKVKSWNKLKKKKDRMHSKTFLIEGFHLIEEVHTSNWTINEIILQENIDAPEYSKIYPVTIVSANVFKNISNTKSPQGIAAIVQVNQMEWKDFQNVLLVDALQDPGNLGTIIRTAVAAGFDAVILGENTVDMYNDKVIRSTQGTLFHIPVFQEDLLKKIPELKRDGFTICASALKNATFFQEANTEGKIALIVGNEGAGINNKILEMADTVVKIPIKGKAESLNVSVAAGILMYHFSR